MANLNNTRSKYVFYKTVLDPALTVDPWLRDWGVGWAHVWAKHEHDEVAQGSKPFCHYHGVIRFASTVSWQWFRDRLMRPDNDPHSYSAPGRGWQRCVRYLLHLDSPDKPPIPRSNLSYSGEISEDEISMLLGRPRASLLSDIRNAPRMDTFSLVDWLVNEKGHTPGEVAQMLRCITAVNSYLGPLSLLSRPGDIPGSFGPSSMGQDSGLPEVDPFDDEDDLGIPDDLDG